MPTPPVLHPSQSSPQIPLHRRLNTVPLYLNFAATGIAMALPGSILPILLSRWHMPDNQAGLLFFSTFAGTSIGALLTRKPIHRSLALGNLLFALACLAVAVPSLETQPSLPTVPRIGIPLLLFALYGTGLGLSMTSITLLQSNRQREKSNHQTAALALNRLNLTWSVGACLAPTLAAHSLAILDLNSLFTAIAILFGTFFLSTLLLERDPHSLTPPTDPALPLNSFRPTPTNPAPTRPLPNPPKPASRLPWPIPVLIAILLPTGIEASLGAWIATYTQRSQLPAAQFATHIATNLSTRLTTPLTGHILALTVSAGTAFWTGLLLSRTLSSWRIKTPRKQRHPLQPSPPPRRLLVSCFLVPLSLTLLISSHIPAVILLAVSLIGFGLGPIYPSLLAQALHYSDNPAIFFIAGIGSSLLPWLTGTLSTHTSSLTIGLTVPLAASVLLLILTLKINR